RRGSGGEEDPGQEGTGQEERAGQEGTGQEERAGQEVGSARTGLTCWPTAPVGRRRPEPCYDCLARRRLRNHPMPMLTSVTTVRVNHSGQVTSSIRKLMFVSSRF